MAGFSREGTKSCLGFVAQENSYQGSTTIVAGFRKMFSIVSNTSNNSETKASHICLCCTVHLEGDAVRSCVTPMSRVEGKRVTTIEGLSSHLSHPVQRAWMEIQVPQCGYCQPGQMMSAACLLAQKPKPNDADIDDAMSGNLCRCGTYQRVRKAIHRAAEIAGGSGTTK